MKLTIFATLAAAASAFTFQAPTQQASTALNAESRREAFAKIAGVAAGFAAAAPAFADREYNEVGLLGGGQVVDVNNANVRVYLKMPGLYPGVAGKIVTNGPYNSVGDLYAIKGLSSAEKDLIKKYESRFTVKPAKADYVIDRYNNGLYR